MAKYMLTGIDPDQWKRFKAACNIRGCTIKDSFIDHINIIVGGFQPHIDQPRGHYGHTPPLRSKKPDSRKANHKEGK